MYPIITPKALMESLKDNAVVLVDATNSPTALENYKQSHLNDALFVDVNTQLADIKEDVSEGGRHPLPSVNQFSKTLSQLGITPETWVVVYDNKNGANAAARFWWMLRSIGHKKVQVLNGGYQAAVQSGFPTTSVVKKPIAVDLYPIENWQWPIISLQEIDELIQKDAFIVIDVRESYRFDGISEPIDLIAGHIPGAKNIPFTFNLDTNGFFLSPDQLKEKYQNTIGTIPIQNQVVHCGSGITACHTLLAMEIAGLPIPKLYVGSWSEWSRNNKEIEKN